MIFRTTIVESYPHCYPHIWKNSVDNFHFSVDIPFMKCVKFQRFVENYTTQKSIVENLEVIHNL
jgi:hypothetical protein